MAHESIRPAAVPHAVQSDNTRDDYTFGSPTLIGELQDKDVMETNTRRAAVDAASLEQSVRLAERHFPPPISLEQLRRYSIAAHARNDWQAAIKGYQACLQIKPDSASIWCNLGVALRKLKQYQSAVNCYRRALELSPGDLIAKGNLANALKDLHRLDESIALHQQVTAAKPADVTALLSYACALREAGQFETALEVLNRAQLREPANAFVEWERAQNLLYLGHYTEGFKAYEARWRTGDLPQTDYGCPQWFGENLTGKTILLHAEQGYGDTILATRFISAVKQRVGQSGQVILQCKPELHRLFKNIGADQLIKPGEPQVPVDMHCPLMSLMGVLSLQTDTIPPPANLHIPDAARQRFATLAQHHPGCLKVGIVWSGSITFANNDNRSVSLKQFVPLAEIPNVRLYSLQKGPRQIELQECGAQAFIHDLGSLCDDFADTAAAIEHLDVIVMTDSSVAHLAASLNKPVINLLQKVPYWLYAIRRDTTPWYPAMRLIRQDSYREWGVVFRIVQETLREFL